MQKQNQQKSTITVKLYTQQIQHIIAIPATLTCNLPNSIFLELQLCFWSMFHTHATFIRHESIFQNCSILLFLLCQVNDFLNMSAISLRPYPFSWLWIKLLRESFHIPVDSRMLCCICLLTVTNILNYSSALKTTASHPRKLQIFSNTTPSRPTLHNPQPTTNQHQVPAQYIALLLQLFTTPTAPIIHIYREKYYLYKCIHS